jgi:hypothetical protein
MGGSNFEKPGFYPVWQSELRNKRAQEALLEYGNPKLVLLGNGDMRLYNSPRIVGVYIKQGDRLIYRYGFGQNHTFPVYPYEWDYPGDLSNCPQDSAIPSSEPLNVEILFSSDMNPASIQVLIKNEDGSYVKAVEQVSFGGHVFKKDLWIGRVNLSDWREEYGDVAILNVYCEDAFQGDLNSSLDTNGDGDSDGWDSNHKFFISSLEGPCVASHYPPDGAIDVSVLTPITITFTRPMDIQSTESAIVITPDFSKAFKWSSDLKTVTIIPTDTLKDLKYSIASGYFLKYLRFEFFKKGG